MAGVATAIVTVASMSSIAYQLTRLMLYKAAEFGASAALTLLSRKPDSLGKVQYILMELDVEAKFKSVRSLLQAIEEDRVGLSSPSQSSRDFILVCIANVHESMDSISKTLSRIHHAMDEYAAKWLQSWRSLDVVDDLHLLKVECKMFDKRLETLIQCLGVPIKAGENREQQTLMEQRLLGDAEIELGAEAEDLSETDRMTNWLRANRAIKEAEMAERKKDAHQSEARTIAVGATTTYIFEDPVFL